jgi:hypothetical protein
MSVMVSPKIFSAARFANRIVPVLVDGEDPVRRALGDEPVPLLALPPRFLHFRARQELPPHLVGDVPQPAQHRAQDHQQDRRQQLVVLQMVMTVRNDWSRDQREQEGVERDDDDGRRRPAPEPEQPREHHDGRGRELAIRYSSGVNGGMKARM